jgi:hypothetical protein
MDGTSRPALACLDTPEIRAAAAGDTEDPAIQEHLARCKRCRRDVQELRRALGAPPTWSGGASYRRSLLARPGFWLLLIVLALLAFGLKVLMRDRGTPQPEPPAASEPEQPAATAAAPTRSRPRRARPARTGGSAADAEIIAVIRNNQTGVRVCYERALKRDPGLSLRLNARVSVNSAGAVDRVSLDGLPAGGLLDDCLRNIMKNWKFPPAPEAYEAAFPLRLQQSP